MRDLRVEDPFLHVLVGVICLVRGLVPVVLDLSYEAILVLLGSLLDFLTLGIEVVLELVGVPGVVWLDDVVLPVLLD